MTDQNTTAPLVLRLDRLEHRLEDKARNQRFTIHVDIPLEFRSGDFIGLLGPSGCGKTTLLTILGLLRKPTHLDLLGDFLLYYPDGKTSERNCIDLKRAWQDSHTRSIERLRRRHMGFALQSGELVSSLTASENIALPLLLNDWDRKVIDDRIVELLDKFRLTRVKGASPARASEDRSTSKPTKRQRPRNALAGSRINRLSGGEYQRVALARAIAHRPSVVFVDEPTSALNRELANDALTTMQTMQQKSEQPGITFMITHDRELANRFCNVLVEMAPRSNEPAGEVVEVTRV